MRTSTLFLLGATAAAAFELPASLDAIYNTLNSTDANCKKYIDSNHKLYDGHDNQGWGFCRDLPGAVYVRGPEGKLGDMDVDCTHFQRSRRERGRERELTLTEL